MDYQKIYSRLCELGRAERNLDYIENHHILPKCLDGSDETENITKLTGREHYEKI